MKPTKKELRAKAIKIMRAEPMIGILVMEITSTGRTKARSVVPRIVKMVRAMNAQLDAPDPYSHINCEEDNIAEQHQTRHPEPTKEDWQRALTLSDAFLSRGHYRGKEMTQEERMRGLPKQRDISFRNSKEDAWLSRISGGASETDKVIPTKPTWKQGALNFTDHGLTGYVNAKGALPSAIVRYQCDCGNEGWTSMQRLKQGQKVCGINCKERKKDGTQRNRSKTQEAVDAAIVKGINSAKRAAQMANQIMTNISKEIH